MKKSIRKSIRRLACVALSMVMVASLSFPSYASESTELTGSEKNKAYEEAIKHFEENRPSGQVAFNKLKAKKKTSGDSKIAQSFKTNKAAGLSAETYNYSETILKTEDSELVASVSISEISQLPINSKITPGISVQGGSLRENDWDTSISVFAEVTCYYDTRKAYDGVKMYNLYAVSVSNRVDDKSVSIYSQKLVYGASALSEYGYATTQTATKYPSSSYAYYNTGFGTYVRDWAGNMGATYILTLQRRSPYKWEFEIQCMVF